MDRITSGFLKAFRQEQSLPEDLAQFELFEHFVNYCIVSKEYNDSFSLEDIHVGGGPDKALDGIAILVNGSLISSKEELEDLEKRNKYLDVEFILVQSKTSSTFDAGDIAKFLLGSQDFFSENPELPNKSQVAGRRSQVKKITLVLGLKPSLKKDTGTIRVARDTKRPCFNPKTSVVGITCDLRLATCDF